MNVLHIRPARPADLARIFGLRNAAARHLIDRGIRQWAENEVTLDELAEHVRAGLLFAAERDGQVVGAMRLQWADPDIWGVRDDGSAGYVHTLVTDLSGGGIGAAMLAWAAERIVERGRGHLRLDCVADNPGLRAYYRGQGFIEVGVLPEGKPGWQPLMLLEKSLI